MFLPTSKKNTLLFCFLLFSLPFTVLGQKNYWVIFSDKKDVTFHPKEDFSPAAIEKRLRLHIPFSCSDWPLNKKYKEQVHSLVKKTIGESRWLNALAIEATPSQIKKIRQLPFVKDIVSMHFSTYKNKIYKHKLLKNDITSQYHLLRQQTERMGASLFRKKDLCGKGIRIAIFDAGFPSVPTHPAFTHLIAQKRIIATWDFTRNKETVFRGNPHGTMVLSCIAGKMGALPMGLAPEAEFLLAITEVGNELLSEESYWVAAMEWADRQGADIINSSLGYTFHRYFPQQMDGTTSLVAQAAQMASKKGILVVNAAGNEGSNRWEVIGTPADAPHILSVGALDPQTGLHYSFSSLGPTADGRLKPNVCAFGQALVANRKGNFQIAYGTSFAAPLITGFAACAWQQNKNYTNIELLHAIEKSSDLYPYFDYAHGYGVPQAKYFTKGPSNKTPTFNLFASTKFLYIRITDEIWERLSGYEKSRVFYNIQAPDGKLKSYYVVDVYQQEALRIPLSFLKEGDFLNISYMGYSKQIPKSQISIPKNQ